jgi:hypothetical protein
MAASTVPPPAQEWRRYTLLLSGLLILLALPLLFRSHGAPQFLPHTFCYLNDHRLITVNVITDTLIWLSYLTITAALCYLAFKGRREIPFSGCSSLSAFSLCRAVLPMRWKS